MTLYEDTETTEKEYMTIVSPEGSVTKGAFREL